MNKEAQMLLEKIEAGDALVGIVGLGYVGLPLALAFGERGFRVLGFDVDAAKVELLDRGETYIDYISNERIAALRRADRLRATSDLSRLGEPDAILVCVPTPLTEHREPDLTFVRRTAEAIRDSLRAGQLVVLESTTYPGTTDGVMRPILEGSGLSAGESFFLAYSPEREDPGNASYGPSSIPKIVGGIDAPATRLADALYSQVVVETVPVSSARTAEASKLLENIFRAVNIALVNELKLVYEAMDIDIWEVLDAASTKPFGFMRFDPGPGWGGHCIPIDPFYLSWRAREFGIPTRFIELAGEVNVDMPRHVVRRLQTALNRVGKPVKGSRVLLLGLAYKKNVADPRESPAFEILDLLQGLEAETSYHDPHIARAPRMRSWQHLEPLTSQPLTPESLASQDAVVIVTDHSSIDWDLVLKHSPLIIDTRGVYPGTVDRVVKA